MLTVQWPDDFGDYAWEVEAKGWFEGVTVEWNGARIRPVFYDPVRLNQEISDELAGGSYFREPNLIVIEKVTRDHMEVAIAAL
ncbi:hypothetical protein [Microbispora bryophytorum]|uniref:Uncharacterized protein n=1 Tax=Microbispora bryophytorum TaxID=1460882 RepID=A0A8H9L8T8_9ACTN|nr:hypothetical protein [Microbispora bryophytorum]MBD3139557.1 hypothetical protein [Microbispora bryophytorum]TQS02850.1 hypothetical protein FLX07_26315 [Microbispora bryophytorum]GGO02670.1 hypothetical protein GCM10011574_11660 [Microbispora bryophytorum]